MAKRRLPPIDAITSEADIARGVRALRRACPVARHMHEETGSPPLRRQEPGFPGLARIVVGQQLSVQSARAIWERCQQKLQPMSPDRVARARETTLRAAGLSAPKIKTLKAVSGAVLAGDLDLAPDAYGGCDETMREALIAVPGIGPWTADIYLMFSLGRPDAFAPGDLALQIGAQYAFDLAERPSPVELEAMAEAWRPWRSVAARLLWQYYAYRKAQKSAATPAIPV